jgi:DNA-binding XRE family transcriptional regulator
LLVKLLPVSELNGSLTGVQPAMKNAIETGKFAPSLPLAFKAARLFKLPIENIFEDEQ